MIRDPLYKSILERLAESPDGDTFERCAQELLRAIYPDLTPVVGGQDLGMDGLGTSSPDTAYLLVATTATNVKRNFVRSLQSHKRQSSSIAVRRAVVATSQPETGRLHESLRQAASDESFQLVALHGRRAFAELLYRSPRWTRELLGLSGAPRALSAVPSASRLHSDLPIIGRDADVQWLSESSGDIVVSGHPASGKTHLLRQFVDCGWLFLVDLDRERVANDVRERRPGLIILDDAHGQLESLHNLKQLRTALDADFRIAAVTWPGDKDGVLQTLGLGDDSALDLPLLSLDEILEVVKSAGIGGSHELQRAIVNQSGGRPGLAATLCEHTLRGDLRSLFSGKSLLREIKTAITGITGPEGMAILAVMALAGDDGTSLEDVCELAGLNLSNGHDVLVRLGHTGVFRASSLTEKASVWPRELRYASVGAMFFSSSGYQNLPLGPALNHFGEQRIVSSLVGAALMGAHVTADTIEPILRRSGSAADFAQYSRLGRREALFALATRPEWLMDIARYSLVTNSTETLQLLLQRAAEDRHVRGTDNDGPLGIIKRWIESAPYHDHSQLERRQLLTSAASRCLTNGGHSQVALDALCLAMDPKFESATSNPGSGWSLTIAQGLVSRECLNGLVDHWPTVRDTIPSDGPQDWSALFEILHDWAFCASLPKSPPEETWTFMRSHASVMAADLVGKFSEHPGILTRISEISRRANLGVDVGTPNPFATLYPIRPHPDDFEEESARRSEAARRLAVDLEPCGPGYVLPLILSANRSAALTGINWPDETSTVMEAIAARVADPYRWAERSIDLRLTPLAIEPLLRVARTKDCKAALPLVLRALNSESAWPAGVAVVLTVEDRLEIELEATLDLVPQFMDGLATLIARKQVPEPTLRWLLAHPSPHVAETTAVHLWSRNERPRVPDDLFEDWREAMLRVPGREPLTSWLFTSETDLFAEWLLIHLSSGAWRDSYDLASGIDAATENLSVEQRTGILAAIRENEAYFHGWLVQQLVGDDPSSFKQLLAMDHLSAVHEDGFGSVSEPKIKIACAAGWTPDRIASVVMVPRVPTVESGRASENLRKRLEYFEGLAKSEDSEIAAVGRAGCSLCRPEIERAMGRERDEEVYGFDTYG